MPKIIYVANTDWYLYNFRLSLMKAMARERWEIIAVAPESSYGKKLEGNGVRFLPFEMDRKGRNPIRDSLLVQRLFGIYKREQPDIVHHFTIKPVIYGSFAAKFFKNMAVINAVTGLGYVFQKKGITQKLVKGLYRLALKGNNYTIFQNEENLSYFIQKGLVFKERAFLIRGSGVDIYGFSPNHFKNQAEKKEVVFLMASRVLWDKGVREFVAAAEAVKVRFPEAVFWLAGGVDRGNPSAVPESWLKEKVERGIVVWWGHRDDIKSFIQNTDVIVLPSYHEGLPKILLEGAAMEKPIITTNVPGCREVVEEGINGLLVPVRDVEKLAEAMIRMIENPELRVKMGKRGRKKIVRDFSDERVIHETLEVYRMARPKLFL